MSKWLCVDVDGVLADNSDPNVEYYDRPAYPNAVEFMQKLKAAGFKIRILTARGMDRFGGDVEKAHRHHFAPLAWWLREHNIPYDEIYFGKPAAAYYIDDNAWRVRSGDGDAGWETLLAHLGVS